MPRYCFICECGATDEVARPMANSGDPQSCPQCGRPMDRDLQAEHSSARGDYAEPIESSSLAFDSRDVADHRRKFPGVELKVDGHTAYPVLRSLSQKREYLKGRGWVDHNGYF